MGEKSDITLTVGVIQDGKTFTISGLQGIPEITPEVEINDMEDFTKALRTGSDSVIIPCKFSKTALIKLRWIFWKAHVKRVFYDLRQILKSVFSEED